MGIEGTVSSQRSTRSASSTGPDGVHHAARLCLNFDTAMYVHEQRRKYEAAVGGTTFGKGQVCKLGSRMNRNTESEMEKAPVSRDGQGRSLKACAADASTTVTGLIRPFF